MRRLSRTLWGFGTAVLIFGLLFAQTKTTDHTPDLVIWLIATLLLVGALILGLMKRSTVGPEGVRILGPIVQVIILGELLLCVIVIVDVVKHLHSL